MKNKLPSICKRIAIRSMTKNKFQTISIILAILMTTVLLTATLSSSFCISTSIHQARLEKAAWKGHLVVAGVTDVEYEAMKSNQRVEAVSSYRHFGFIKDDAQTEVIELQYSDDLMADWMFYHVEDGYMPKKKNEIVVSTQFLQDKGLSYSQGMDLELSYEVNGQFESNVFRVTGVYTKIKTSSQVAFVSKAFLEEKVKTMSSSDNYDSAFNNRIVQVIFNDSASIEDNTLAFLEETNLESHRWQINRAYAKDGNNAYTLAVYCLIALVVLSGVLIIYTIISISVQRNINFYGSLLTNGFESQQVSRMVRYQVRILSIIAIPIGLVLGSFLSIFLLPRILLTGSSVVVNGLPSMTVFLASGLLVYLTVYLSSIKPLGEIKAMTPMMVKKEIEVSSKNKKSKNGHKLYRMAWKDVMRNKKKSVFIWVSLALSIIVSSLSYSLVTGTSLEAYLSFVMSSDYIVGTKSYFNSLEINNDALSSNVVDDLLAMPGIEDSGAASSVFIDYTLKGEQYEKFKDLFPSAHDRYGENSRFQLIGLDEYITRKSQVLRGEIDLEKFANGKYVLINTFVAYPEETYYEPGETITLTLSDGHSKDYEVMAVISEAYDYSPRVREEAVLSIFMPRDELYKQFGDIGVYNYSSDVDDDYIQAWDDKLATMMSSGEDLVMESKTSYANQFGRFFNVVKITGLFVTCIFGLIGLLNFINVINASIYDRKYELAVMQSMGMSVSSIYALLVIEALYHILLALGISIVIGMPLIYGLTSLVALAVPIFTKNVSVLPYLVFLVIGVFLSIVTPSVFYYFLNKKEHFLYRIRSVK